MTSMTSTPTPITSAECGRCGAGEDVCARCDLELAITEALIRTNLSRCYEPADLVTYLRAQGLPCAQLGHLVEVEGLGALRCTRSAVRCAEWVLVAAGGEVIEGERLVMMLASQAWEVRYVR